VGTLLDGKRHVVDVAVSMWRGLERDGLSADDTGDRPAHDHLAAGNHSGYLAFLADDDLGRLHVRMPRLMIFKPWPMILRSLPMTDFSPLEAAVIDRCAPLAPGVRTGSSGLGSTEELRVNMKTPSQGDVTHHP
jgi:hypothetical protein